MKINSKRAAECKRLLSFAQQWMFDRLLNMPEVWMTAADIRERFHCTKASTETVCHAYGAYWDWDSPSNREAFEKITQDLEVARATVEQIKSMQRARLQSYES